MVVLVTMGSEGNSEIRSAPLARQRRGKRGTRPEHDPLRRNDRASTVVVDPPLPEQALPVAEDHLLQPGPSDAFRCEHLSTGWAPRIFRRGLQLLDAPRVGWRAGNHGGVCGMVGSQEKGWDMVVL